MTALFSRKACGGQHLNTPANSSASGSPNHAPFLISACRALGRKYVCPSKIELLALFRLFGISVSLNQNRIHFSRPRQAEHDARSLRCPAWAANHSDPDQTLLSDISSPPAATRQKPRLFFFLPREFFFSPCSSLAHSPLFLPFGVAGSPAEPSERVVLLT